MNTTTRTDEGRFVNPLERRLMFQRGFGDGAKLSAIKFSEDLDYMEAYSAGLSSRNLYLLEVTRRYGFPEPTILRLQEGGEG